MSLEIVLSCKELVFFKSQSILTGERGAIEEGAEEVDEETEGATVNAVLFDDVSGLSDLIWLLVEGKTKLSFSAPVGKFFELLTPLSYVRKLA